MKNVIISAAVLGLALTSSPVLASGSGGGGGGGGFGGSFSGGSGSSSRLSEADRLERRGKSQVRKRITCKKCDYNGRLNKQTASEVAKAVRSGKYELTSRNRQAVLFYLRQRYGV